MQSRDGLLLLSATDLVAFSTCQHLSARDLVAARGATERGEPGETSALVARKGEEHEARCLSALEAGGLEVVSIPSPFDPPSDAPDAFDATRAALAAGAEVIYQAALAARRLAGFRGLPRTRSSAVARLLATTATRCSTPSSPAVPSRATWSSSASTRICSRASRDGCPEHMHVVLGSRERQTFRLR